MIDRRVARPPRDIGPWSTSVPSLACTTTGINSPPAVLRANAGGCSRPRTLSPMARDRCGCQSRCGASRAAGQGAYRCGPRCRHSTRIGAGGLARTITGTPAPGRGVCVLRAALLQHATHDSLPVGVNLPGNDKELRCRLSDIQHRVQGLSSVGHTYPSPRCGRPELARCHGMSSGIRWKK